MFIKTLKSISSYVYHCHLEFIYLVFIGHSIALFPRRNFFHLAGILKILCVSTETFSPPKLSQKKKTLVGSRYLSDYLGFLRSVALC